MCGWVGGRVDAPVRTTQEPCGLQIDSKGQTQPFHGSGRGPHDGSRQYAGAWGGGVGMTPGCGAVCSRRLRGGSREMRGRPPHLRHALPDQCASRTPVAPHLRRSRIARPVPQATLGVCTAHTFTVFRRAHEAWHVHFRLELDPGDREQWCHFCFDGKGTVAVVCAKLTDRSGAPRARARARAPRRCCGAPLGYWSWIRGNAVVRACRRFGRNVCPQTPSPPPIHLLHCPAEMVHLLPVPSLERLAGPPKAHRRGGGRLERGGGGVIGAVVLRGARPSGKRVRERQQTRTLTGALSASWARHGQDTKPQKRN